MNTRLPFNSGSHFDNRASYIRGLLIGLTEAKHICEEYTGGWFVWNKGAKECARAIEMKILSGDVAEGLRDYEHHLEIEAGVKKITSDLADGEFFNVEPPMNPVLRALHEQMSIALGEPEETELPTYRLATDEDIINIGNETHRSMRPDADEQEELLEIVKNVRAFEFGGYPEGEPESIDMVLHCPQCGMQHIDKDNSDEIRIQAAELGITGGRDWEDFIEKNEWTNPVHKSHLCGGCGHQWRPCEVPTNGVEKVNTKGENDSPIVQPMRRTERPGDSPIVAQAMSIMDDAFDDCIASGQAHKMGPYGPDGETQCMYCGEPSKTPKQEIVRANQGRRRDDKT